MGVRTRLDCGSLQLVDSNQPGRSNCGVVRPPARLYVCIIMELIIFSHTCTQPSTHPRKNSPNTSLALPPPPRLGRRVSEDRQGGRLTSTLACRQPALHLGVCGQGACAVHRQVNGLQRPTFNFSPLTAARLSVIGQGQRGRVTDLVAIKLEGVGEIKAALKPRTASR